MCFNFLPLFWFVFAGIGNKYFWDYLPRSRKRYCALHSGQLEFWHIKLIWIFIFQSQQTSLWLSQMSPARWWTPLTEKQAPKTTKINFQIFSSHNFSFLFRFFRQTEVCRKRRKEKERKSTCYYYYVMRRGKNFLIFSLSLALLRRSPAYYTLPICTSMDGQTDRQTDKRERITSCQERTCLERLAWIERTISRVLRNIGPRS